MVGAVDRERTFEVSDPNIRSLWLAVSALAASLVAICAGLLSWASGASVPSAVLASGAAFAGATLFLLGILRFVTEARR
jgi:hypothetical protein